jgi:HD-GYP domain-containing protein (c-di-GMP phosphodiesterase class II)
VRYEMSAASMKAGSGHPHVTRLRAGRLRSIVDTSHPEMQWTALEELSRTGRRGSSVASPPDASAIRGLIRALACKDAYTASHSVAVHEIAQVLARGMGVEIGYAGLLHDVGKLYVPDALLQKKGQLTEQEYELVKEHSIYGYWMLYPLSRALAWIVLMAHERPDGRGYPFGVTRVPLESGIVAVADTLHALVSDRPYRARRSFDEAIEEIRRVSGSQLPTDVVDALGDMTEDVRRVVGHAGSSSDSRSRVVRYRSADRR